MNKALALLTVIMLGFAVAVSWTLQSGPLDDPLSATVPPVDNTALSQQPVLTWGNGESRSDAHESSTDETEDIDSAERLRITEQRREQVRELIHRLRPQQDESTVAVWVDEFAHLSSDEIRFLIQQTGIPGSEAGRRGDSPGVEVLTSETHLELSGRSSHAETVGLKEPRIETARTNLRNMMTVGYRDLLDLRVLSAGTTANPLRISLRRMTVGQAIETGDPLHVALQTPGLVFFHLEDGRLTRNGMFARMHHGRLGLRAGDGFVPLQDSPVLPVGLRCTILSDGRVTDADTSRQIGKIRVVMADRSDQLTTEDGVYFHCDADVRLAEHFSLQPRAVELGNVDPRINRQWLELSSASIRKSAVLVPEVGPVD